MDPQIYREMGLNDHEYELIVERLGREPNYTEIGMMAVMWSEHCGYKYSRPVLRRFGEYKKAMDEGSMENAGVTDIGDGYGIVFKVESHNHPSAVEPFQGAATGVGGILRDIFTMGARPIANLNSLRFGDLDDPHNQWLFKEVVGGIAHYGNCVGVPTVAGEVVFHPCYTGNCLVNAMAVGLVKHSDVATAAAEGIGNPVLYVGSSTGRDGIHGATFASVELTEESEAKRSNVQMGDPFAEKLLIEATLEALASGDVVGIQDMGAAGLTCSTCETASKGGNGMIIDVQKVPRREQGMSAYEVMLSESQERMLAIVKKGREEAVAGIFKKWGCKAVVVGEVTDDGWVTVMDGNELAARVPARFLTDECPTYTLNAEKPGYIDELQAFDPTSLPVPEDLTASLKMLLSDTTIASKRWVYEQYDHMVQTQTAGMPGGDAAMLRVRGVANKGLAIKIDGNGRYVYLDPRMGGMMAVVEACRNVSCTGAKPLAATDCLNFGNPEKKDIFWQFEQAVDGIATACEALGTPVVSGNVSLYNETLDTAVFPTPTIGIVGLIEDVDKACSANFKNAGDVIALLIPSGWEDPIQGLGGSQYLYKQFGIESGMPPIVDLTLEVGLQAAVREAIDQRLLSSAHDCSDGGLSITVCESALAGNKGADIHINSCERPDSVLFGETASRIVVSLPQENMPALEDIAIKHGCSAAGIGVVTNDGQINFTLNGKLHVGLSVTEANVLYEGAIPNALNVK
ncbi:MAG: phosphoribosylformylglycinamidine synthase subunit PurL [Armatimonadota bacterium]